MLGAGGPAKKTYVDDVFSTLLYTGDSTQSPQVRNNGINLAGEGGLVWAKRRNGGHEHGLYDTVRGVEKRLSSDSSSAEETASSGVKSFTSTGFTTNQADDIGGNGDTYSSWTFRKAKGFFDVVTWDGNGTAGRVISHSLGSVPGLIMIKSTTDATSWFTYHRSLGAEKYVMLNENNAEADQTWFMNDTAPTSTGFSVGGSNNVNGSGRSYVAYVFAGGENTAATARSVDFDGSGDYLKTGSSSDLSMGTGDFTVECWCKFETYPSPTVGIFQISETDGGFTTSVSDSICVWVSSNTWRFTANGNINTTVGYTAGSWNHIALVRHSAVTTLYLNGNKIGSHSSDTRNLSGTYLGIGGYYSSSYTMDGFISNFRVVKGTAVYTSSFKPSTEPLTNITNTKLLCCQSSTVTASTGLTLSAEGDPAASTDTPFDDPTNFSFGENGDQNLIKCGSYLGTDQANSHSAPVIDLGWEPQWLMVKAATSGGSWYLIDSMRAFGADKSEIGPPTVSADTVSAEEPWNDYDLWTANPTGFTIGPSDLYNVNNQTAEEYIYMAIRRPDGYCAKPADAGTDVFTTAERASSTAPRFISNFPVDFALYRNASSTMDWFTTSRLTGPMVVKINATDEQTENSDYANFDHNNGFQNQAASGHQAWMWKRGAGFDVVNYKGDGYAGKQVPHNLGRIPEMMWVMAREDSGEERIVYHKGLDGGNQPETHNMYLHNTDAELDTDAAWNDTAPTATHFTLGGGNAVNKSNKQHLCMLFASVDGISKVGYYAGNGSTQTLTFGFQPRFLIVRPRISGYNWYTVDTVRGWAADNDNYLNMDSDTNAGSAAFGQPTSTGWNLDGNGTHFNGSGQDYIYYAHA